MSRTHEGGLGSECQSPGCWGDGIPLVSTSHHSQPLPVPSGTGSQRKVAAGVGASRQRCLEGKVEEGLTARGTERAPR